MKSTVGTALLLISFLFAIATGQTTKRLETQGNTGISSLQVFGGSWGLLNANRLTYWGRSDGTGGHSSKGNDGGFFPRGTGHVLYEDGFVWGGKVFRNSQLNRPASTQPIRVGGAYYWGVPGTNPGWISGSGSSAVPAEATGPAVRIYRIRRDYFSMSSDAIRRDAAEVNEIPESDVTQSQMDEVRNNYATDWTSWPVNLGAPYIERNGTPGYQAPPLFSSTFTVDSLIAGNYDEPGIAGSAAALPATQVTWTVFNDLDSTKTLGAFACLPMGLECQLTSWAYDRPDDIGNVIFRRLKMINKGGVDTTGAKGSFWIDSMYVMVFSDPDIGLFYDDLYGCDSVLNAGFVYNGDANDRIFSDFNLAAPALGYAVLDGPLVVSDGDTGRIDFQSVVDRRNLPMTSFAPEKAGDPYMSPWTQSYDTLAAGWWKWLRGYKVPYGNFSTPDMLYASGPFPPSKFPFSGDPVTGTGWVDGKGTPYSFGPGDCRITVSSGPFTMAPGDTQEVVTATVGGIGADYLSSVAAMKTAVRSAQRMNDAFFNLPVVPSLNAEVTYPSPATATLAILAHGHSGTETGMHVEIYRSDSSLVGDLTLYDDGLHGDGAGGDAVFGNSFTTSRDTSSLFGDLTVYYNADSLRFNKALDHLFTAGDVSILGATIFDDNGNSDGKANPGEVVHYGLTVSNNSSLPLPSLKVVPSISFGPSKVVSLGTVGAGMDSLLVYDAGDPNTYFSIQIQASTADTVVAIPVQIVSGYFAWVDTVDLPVTLAAPEHLVVSELHHITGKAEGSPAIRIADTSLVKDHTYEIIGVDSIAAGDFNEPIAGLTIRDKTLNTVVAANIPFPDSLGFLAPLADGFKLLPGTLIDPKRAGMKGWSVPTGTRVWTWENNAGNLLFEGFNGAIGWISPRWLYGDGVRGTRPSQLVNVLIKFATTDTSGTVLDGNDPNWSYGYRYLRNASQPAAKPEFTPYILNAGTGYAFQAFEKNVPFSAWDVDSDPPQRLAVGFLENNVPAGMVDGKYWPPFYQDADNTISSGPREWFFIFAAPYAETANPSYEVEMIANSLPILWFGTPARKSKGGFSSSDQFLIEAAHVITSNDSWTFNPTITGVEKSSLPLQFALSNNFPNPFNPATTVEFQVPAFGRVSVKVYDLLGRVVATLVDGERAPGTYKIRWDASTMPSGVYFCRMTAGSFVSTRKMVLLK